MVIGWGKLYVTIGFRCTIAKVRYRKDPHMQNSIHKLTLTLTLTDIGGAVLTLMLGYRSLYITWQYRPFAIAYICDSGLSPTIVLVSGDVATAIL